LEIIKVSISWTKHNIPGTLPSKERATDQQRFFSDSDFLLIDTIYRHISLSHTITKDSLIKNKENIIIKPKQNVLSDQRSICYRVGH